MPEPEINTLQPQTGPGLDRINIPANNTDVPAVALKVTPIRPAAAGAPPADPPTRRRRRKKEAPKYLQEEELARFFKAIDSVRDRALFRVAYHAGLRASEVGMLQMRDYNPKTERLFIHALKGSNDGEHPLCREEARALRAWLKVRGDQPGPIFTTARGRISRSMLDVLMKAYGEKAGIPGHLRHFHVLKHSCGTHLFNRGMTAEMVQDWMRHADIRNTMIYAKITNKRRDEMARSLQDWK